MLTELQRKKNTHYFNLMDFDRSGTLEKEDFTSIGENLAILWGFKPDTQEWNDCLTRSERTWVEFRSFVGKADDGSASLEEWLHFADANIVNGSEELYEHHVNKLAKEIISFFDVNNDGYISLDEYVDLFMAYRIEIRYSAKAFTKLDRDGNDLISREELLKALREFFRSDDINAPGNWLFGFWETQK